MVRTGVTFWQSWAVARRLPEVAFVYYGDNAHTPYGVRDPDDIYALTCRGVERLWEHLAWFLERYPLDLVTGLVGEIISQLLHSDHVTIVHGGDS